MNNSVALLYNFNEEKLKMIKMVCMMMQVRFKEVARAEYEQPLGALLGISGIENHGEVYQGEEFQEEMLVLHGFDGSKLQKFLIALQRVGVGRIELKAMITENNKSWNGLAYFFSKIFSEIIQAKIITAPLIPVKVNFSLSKKYEAAAVKIG